MQLVPSDGVETSWKSLIQLGLGSRALASASSGFFRFVLSGMQLGIEAWKGRCSARRCFDLITRQRSNQALKSLDCPGARSLLRHLQAIVRYL